MRNAAKYFLKHILRTICLSLGLSACTQVGESPKIEGDQTLGGRQISAQLLKRGQEIYLGACASCHGVKGDGRGPVGLHQNPPPRDLRQGIIKFASVPVGELPTDEDLARVVKNGLRGTAMLAWPVADADIKAVIQYIKLFSSRWQKEKAGKPIVVGKDVFAGKREQALKLGEELYHTKAQCSLCHPAFSATFKHDALRDKDKSGQARVDDTSGHATKFGKDVLRAGDKLEDIYRAVAAGVGGTAMPSWSNALSAQEIWAIAYYVQDLNLRENQRP